MPPDPLSGLQRMFVLLLCRSPEGNFQFGHSSLDLTNARGTILNNTHERLASLMACKAAQ
jgi:hypothetical protein